MTALRIADFKVAEGRHDEAIQAINGFLIPRMESAAGFISGYWVLDEASGEGTAVTLWASEEARATFGTASREAMMAGGALSSTTIRDLPLVAMSSGAAATRS